MGALFRLPQPGLSLLRFVRALLGEGLHAGHLHRCSCKVSKARQQTQVFGVKTGVFVVGHYPDGTPRTVADRDGHKQGLDDGWRERFYRREITLGRFNSSGLPMASVTPQTLSSKGL